MGGEGGKALGKPHDGPISRLLNRRVSTKISRFIVDRNIGLTPNQVSFISFILAIVSGALLAMGRLVIGGILVQLSSIIDGVDGEIARLRGLSSKRGGFLDTMLDRYSDIAIYMGVSLYLSTSENLVPGMPLEALFAVIVLAVSGDLAVTYLHLKGEEAFARHPATIGPLDSLASRDVRLFIIFISCVTGYPLVGLLLVALLSHVYVAVKVVYIYDWAGRLEKGGA
ncbi:MAG: CDP-alcohol phosphatidyltransferase family protein [Desulfurococcales archaeon]|nr:CDP-alcohol phosphatidyltransferase family protein [Desulfurococcales archaeon]